LKLQLRAIEKYDCWMQPKSETLAVNGLNFWDPLLLRFHLKWGVSLEYIRSIIPEDDYRSRFWTISEVFNKVIKPTIQGDSLVGYLKKFKADCVNADVDWFLSPSCLDCVWGKVMFEGGICINAREPKPLFKGNRFIFMDLFVQPYLH